MWSTDRITVCCYYPKLSIIKPASEETRNSAMLLLSRQLFPFYPISFVYEERSFYPISFVIACHSKKEAFFVVEK
jgi:hypothetical protein